MFRTFYCFIAVLKNSRFLLPLFFLILLSCNNSKKEVTPEPEIPGPADGIVRGSIVFPDGARLDTTALTILSPDDTVIPLKNKYELDTAGKFTTIYLTNKLDQVLLMGYAYPGSKTNDVSAESTALALLMNTAPARSLTDAGKTAFINNILKDANYAVLVNEIKNAIKAGKHVTDPTNERMSKALVDVFTSASSARTSDAMSWSEPLTISTANTQLSIQNNGVAHTQMAGIYRNGERVKVINVPGFIFFPTNVRDAIQGIAGDGYGGDMTDIYAMNGDGEYQIRIRSGNPLAMDVSSDEWLLAFHSNVIVFTFNQIWNFLPKIPKDCQDALVIALEPIVVNGYITYQERLAGASSAALYSGLMMQMIADVFKNSADISIQCGTPYPHRYMSLAGNVVDYMQRVSAVLNIAKHAIDLFASKSAIDTCFQVQAGKAVPCIDRLFNAKLSYVSGNNQKAGRGSQLANPLYVRVTDISGKGIRDVDVAWRVKVGGGSLSAAVTKTDANGGAYIQWTMGYDTDDQVAEAVVKKADGTSLNGSPVEFKATSSQSVLPFLIGKWKLDVYEYYTEANANKIVRNYENHHFLFNGDGTFAWGEGEDPSSKGTFSVRENNVTILAPGFGQGNSSGFKYQASFPTVKTLMLKGYNQGIFQEFRLHVD